MTQYSQRSLLCVVFCYQPEFSPLKYILMSIINIQQRESTSSVLAVEAVFAAAHAEEWGSLILGGRGVRLLFSAQLSLLTDYFLRVCQPTQKFL